MTGVVIIGAGHAGVQLAAGLRDANYEGSITLICDEACIPYQRPPLSKAFMLGKVDEAGLCLRNADFFERLKIDLKLGQTAERIDRAEKKVWLGSGEALPYDHLVLATGARNRELQIPGSDLNRVRYLKTLNDAQRLRGDLEHAQDVVIVGAGFIGLEFAAIAASVGAKVTVIELGSRVMGRAVSGDIADYFTQKHVGRGVRFLFQTGVDAIIGANGAVKAVRTSDGEEQPADLVLIGIGVVPNSEIAADAGLAIENGIRVDEHLLTDDPDISAIGDCAVYPNRFAIGPVRLESVQNAVDQARAVAARLTGKPVPYHVVPWFWSDQGDDKLQIAGIASPFDDVLVNETAHEGKFSVFCFRNNSLVAVESVNKPTDHMAARKLLQAGKSVSASDLREANFDMKSLAAANIAAA